MIKVRIVHALPGKRFNDSSNRIIADLKLGRNLWPRFFPACTALLQPLMDFDI